MTSKTKYIVIVLLLLVLATTSVGLSTWNIHYQAIVGDIDFTAKEPGTQDSILNRYIYFTPAKDTNGNIATDAEGNITTKKQNYPIGRGGAEDIFTYIYDANPHTPTVFVPSEGNVKGSENYPTNLFLADGALDNELVWGIGDVFDEIEFKYEYRLIAMPYVSEDYKGKSENFCEITAIEYTENKINVYLTWKNGNNGNNQGENVLVELLLSGGNYTGKFNVSVPGDLSEKEIENITKKISVTTAGGLAVGVNGFTPFPIVTAQNGWVTDAPSNAGVYQCRVTAQLKDGASGNIDTANKAIAKLNSLDEGKYAAQVTYAILPRNSEMEQIGYSYEKSSTTEQQIKARRNLANTMPLAESAKVTTDEDGLHTINGNSNSFYVTYGGVGFEISITSTFAKLDGSADVSFPISEYLFTNANALKELLADGQTWDQNENHYYTTYGFSPDPNYQITNPEVHYTILRREVQIDNWTTTDLVYNGTAQSQSAHTNNSYDSTFDYSWTKADGTELDSTPIDAGSYKVWASVGENYYLSCVEGAGTLDETSGKVSFDYTIAPKPVDITWINTDTLVYNGSAQAPTATANGLCTRDGTVDLCTVTVTGEQTNAGTGYTATATALSNPNYVLATKDGGWTTTFKINPKPVNIVWSNTTLTYNGQAQTPTATVATGELCAGDACTVTVTANVESIDVDNYTATATGLSNPNYVLATKEGGWTTTFKINPKPINIVWSNTTLTYNGNAQAPTATVNDLCARNGVTDICTVTIEGAQTNAGTGYTATATDLSNNNYKFADDATLTTSFTINKLTATFSWSNLVSEYDGKTHLPTATVSNICAGDTCTVTIEGAQTNAGTYTATATALSNGNYALPTNATQQFEISPKSITLTWSGATLTYNGQAQAPTASIASGLVAGDTCDVNITGQQTNVGSNYTATATLVNTNYTATNSTQTFEITQLEIGINWTNLSFTYDGISHAPTATATGLVDGDTVTITVDGAQTDAGTGYTATANSIAGASAGNYKLPENATTTFTIDQKTIGISWANTTLEYNGTPLKPTATATGLVGGDTCTVDVTTDGNCINVGSAYTATATAVSNSNYKLPANATKTFAITAKSVTITWAGTTLTYNGNAQAPTATVEGLVSADVSKVSITIDGYQTNAGTGYTATATLAGDKAVNYTITSGSTTTFTINKAPNAIVWGEGMVIDAENNVLVGWTFGSEPIAHTATAAQGGNVAITYYTTYNATTGECSGEFTPSSTTSAGTYYAKAVSQDSGSNYHGTSIVMSFAVTEPSIEDAIVTLSTTTLTYNGTEQTVGVTVKLPSGTVLDSAYYTVTYTLEGEETGTTSIKNAGTYTVTITGVNPYSGTVEVTEKIVVAKAQLTVKANDDSVEYGCDAPAFTVSYSGFVGSDSETTEGLFTGELKCTTTYVAKTTNAGTSSQITPSGLSSANYEITYANGSLSVVRQKISVKSALLEYSYGETNATAIVTNAKGNINFKYDNGKAVTVSYTDGEKTYSADTISIGNTYQINYTIKDTTNYEWATDSATSCYYKYKTAKIGDTYYTVEDAIKTGGNIVLAAGKTSFTSLDYYKNFENPSSYYTIASGTNFFVPHKADVTYDGTDTKDALYSLGGGGSTLYSILYIPSIVGELTVKGSFGIGANMAQGGGAGTRGIVMNEATITLNGKLHCIGYLKSATGSGQIVAKDGAIIVDVMKAYDYKGGSNTLATNDKIFPFNAYSVHNISCDTIIYPGASYSAKFYVSITLIGDVVKDVPIVGTDSLFTLNSGFIKKTARNADNVETKYATALTTESGSNQVAGQKDIVTICGVATDNSIQIKEQQMGTGIDITTGPDYPLPISFMDIYVGDADHVGELNLSSVSYNFLPGTKIEVFPNSTLTVGEGITVYFYTTEQCTLDFGSKFTYTNSGNVNTTDYRFTKICVDYVNAELVVNGTATINGYIGGTITTQDNTGVITITNPTATVEYLATLTYTVTTILGQSIGNSEATTNFSTHNAVGPMVDNAIGGTFTTRNFGSGTYYSTGKSWYSKDGSTIKYYANDGSGTYTEQSFTNGDKVTLSTPTRTGYTFTGWIDDEGNNYAGGSEHTLYANLTLTAQWSINSYTVTFVDEDGTTVLSTETIEFGAKYGPYIPEITLKDGQLLSWQIVETGDTITADTFLALDSNHTIKAVWKSGTTFTVKFETAGGSTISDVNVIEGEAIKLPTSTREHYNLAGWFTEETGGTNVGVAGESYIPTENVTLYARWTPTIYTVEFNANGGTCSTTSDTGSAESAITLPTPTRSYYDFNGWYTAASGGTKVGDAGGSYTPQSNITLYAQWTPTIYTVKFEANGGTCNTTSLSGSAESAITLPKPTRDSYTFNGWYTAASGGTKIGDADQSYEPSADITLYAQWTEISSGGGCLAAGTLITMADGSIKKVEDITTDDYLLVFNHETGQYEASKVLFIDYDGWQVWRVVYLVFDNGTTSRIIYEHGFFDRTLNKYVYIDEFNMRDYIGHEFATARPDGTPNAGTTKLVDAYVVEEYTGCYSPTTVYHLNLIVDGLLSMPGGIQGMFNFFDYDQATLAYDQQAMANDIATYGLMTYEDFADYMSYDVYCCFPAQYIGVSLGKGLMTEEYLQYLIERYIVGMGLEETVATPPQENTNTTDAVEATLPPPVVTGSDDNSGDGDGDSAEDDTSE